MPSFEGKRHSLPQGDERSSFPRNAGSSRRDGRPSYDDDDIFSSSPPRRGGRRCQFPYHPWEWYIYLHEWLIFYGKLVGKYTIHGCYGICCGIVLSFFLFAERIGVGILWVKECYCRNTWKQFISGGKKWVKYILQALMLISRYWE